MKRVVFLGLTWVLMLSLVACGASPNQDASSLGEDGGKPVVLTTMYVTYDFVKAVGGEDVDVRLMVPPGVEAHSYEPTPQDLGAMKEADLIIYTGDEMEPWLGQVVATLGTEHGLVVDTSQGVGMMAGDGGEDGFDDHHHAFDPHIWTSPLNAKIMVDHIIQGLGQVDPDKAEVYTNRGEDYKRELDKLWQEFLIMREGADRDLIVFCGHFAMNYLLHDLDVDYVATTDSLGHEGEPNPRALAEIIDVIQEEGLDYIFEEELSDGRLAKSIQAEVDVEVLKLNGLHNVTKDQLHAGVTYLDLQEENIENLRKGLNQ